MTNSKYGFSWTQENNEWLGVHQENNMYAIASSQSNDGSWSHEILTRQQSQHTGRYTYELPFNQNSWVSTKNINQIVAIVNSRVAYWKSQEK